MTPPRPDRSGCSRNQSRLSTHRTPASGGRQGDNIGFHGIPYRVTSAGNVPIPTPVGIKPVSHGCIRTRDVEAQWLFENMPIGTPVRVVQSRRN